MRVQIRIEAGHLGDVTVTRETLERPPTVSGYPSETVVDVARLLDKAVMQVERAYSEDATP